MAEPLTRWAYTRKKLGLSWVERIVGSVAALVVGVAVGNITPGVIAGLGVLVASTLGKAGWHFSRARIEQEREKLDQLDKRVAQIEATQPKVIVSEDGFNLKVENKGGAATFEAKLLVLAAGSWPLLPGTELDAYWVSKRTSHATILTHGHDRILVGGYAPRAGQPPMGVLSLHFFALNYQTPGSAKTEYSLDQDQLRPFAHIRVTILTNPSVEAPIVREVILRPDGCFLLPL